MKRTVEFIKHNKDHLSIFGFLPEHAKYTTARMVLNPSFDQKLKEMRSQIQNVQAL